MLLRIKLVFILCLTSVLSFASVDDSTGVILKNNKVFILHKVEAGQGLFGVARRYKTVWTAVRDANPGSETKISPGQILLVPTDKSESQFFGSKKPVYSKNNSDYTRPSSPAKPEKEETKPKSTDDNSNSTSFTIHYIVKKGETLFSISQKFSTTVDFLMQLNNLESEVLDEGMEILIPITDPSSADVVIAQKQEEARRLQKELDAITKKVEEEKRVEQQKVDSSVSKSPDKSSSDLPKEETGTTTPLVAEYSIVIENYPEYDVEKVTETGFGKVMTDPKINQTKDWVIHHNAPENTTIKITNPKNNKSIYTKVVKNFTRSENDPLIIYITKNTAEYLELNKKDKFTIKISFAK